MIYSASFLVTMHKGVIENGSVYVSENRIIDVGKRENLLKKFPHARETRLNRCVLMPGLINSHTHLEEGRYRGLLKDFGHCEEWLKALRPKKRGASPETFMNDVHLGALESLHAGVTTLIDSSATGASFNVLQNEKIRSIVHLEFFMDPDDKQEDLLHSTLARAEGFMSNELSGWGISPYPEPCLSELEFRRVTTYAEEQGVPLLMHAGPDHEPLPGTHKNESALAFLSRRKMVKKGMRLIHGRHIEDREIEMLGKSAISLVLCPSSHLKSIPGSQPLFPVLKLLKKGVNLCLGTESPALSESLDLFEEMYLLKRLYPVLKIETILGMAMGAGARAIGKPGLLGQIRSGFLADLVAIELSHSPQCDLLDEVVLEDHEIRFVMVDGREVLA